MRREGTGSSPLRCRGGGGADGGGGRCVAVGLRARLRRVCEEGGGRGGALDLHHWTGRGSGELHRSREKKEMSGLILKHQREFHKLV